jgi:gamma-glutamyltranspeptidase
MRTHHEADDDENDNAEEHDGGNHDDDDHSSTLSGDDFDEDYDFDRYDRGLPPPPGSPWRLVGGLVLLAFLGASIWTTNQKKRVRHAHMDAQLEYCQDPIMSLVDQSLLEGLSHAAVAADHPHCSNMGMAILQEQGGNAVDAAVTVALCLGVANPGSSGMGGGAFMLIHVDAPESDNTTDVPPYVDARNGSSPHAASGKVTEVIDCREIAPSKASTNMYENQPEYATVFGGMAIGVPGELRGLELAHARHGRLPWSQVVDPVMRLAMRGIEVNPNLAHEIKLMASRFNDTSMDFGLRDLLTRGDSWTRPLREGELLQNQRLGELLQDIMRDGSKALYTDRAEALALDIQNAGGIVTAQDIQNYKATIRSPLVAHDINGFSIVGVPPPSSGGAAIIGAARFLSGYQSPLVSYSDTLSRHRLVEACRHVFAIRMSLSDPAFDEETVQQAVNDMIAGDYMEGLRQQTKDDSVLPASKYGGSTWAQLKDSDAYHNVSDAQEGDRQRRRRMRHHFGYLNDGGTSHFSIVDQNGNSVVMTTSVNTYFGSNVVSKSTGIVLSNTIDDFSIPGSPNYFGLRPSVSNYIKPGKKPLSSMSPTLVFRRQAEEEHDTLGTLVLAVGASGGPKIITAVLQVLLSVVMEGMSLYTSIVRPRLHDQLLYHGGTVTTTENAILETGPVIQVSERTKDALSLRDHILLDIDYTGTVQAVSYDPESKLFSAACDVRKGGSPAGY